MSDVIRDDFGQYLEPVDIYDSRGKLLGVFVPASADHPTRAPDVDWAELERQYNSDEPSYPFEEIRGRLAMLEREIERRRRAGEKELSKEEALQFIDRLRTQPQ